MYEDYAGDGGDSSYDPYTVELPNSNPDAYNLGNLFGDTLGGGDNPTQNLDTSGLAAALSATGSKDILGILKSLISNNKGEINYPLLAGLGGTLMTATGLGKAQTGGYKGTIPKMVASREQVAYNDPNRRPGASGRRYFTDTRYTDAAGAPAAREAAKQELAGILAGYTPAAAAAASKAPTFRTPWERTAAPVAASAPQQLPQVPNRAEIGAATLGMAAGGQAKMNEPRYLRGITDGMEDKIDTSIDGKQPAKLSHGEFVIPADVVSHLGNGNSDAGAKKLYQMMDKVRQARTGTKQQGKQINPDKFMPGGAVGYQSGGAVAFEVGGSVGANTTTESNLSNWAGDYVTDTLGKAQAAADQPYQAYQGPLTAGASDLQSQAFSGISNMANTGYTPGTFSAGTFDSGQAAKYMNPYIQNALNPQLTELRRQSQIGNLGTLAKAGQSGIMSGARRDLMESENMRNLLGKQSEVLGTGYANAYDKAMGQFNAEQNRGLDAQKAEEASRQFSANYGKGILSDLGNLGAVQRGIESEGIAADKAEFENQRDWDMKMQQYKMGLLQKMPVSTASNTTNMNPIVEALASSGTLAKLLQGMGLIPTEATTPAASAGVTKTAKDPV